MKVTQSCLTLCDHMELYPWNSPGQNTGVDSPSPSPGDLPNPVIDPWSPPLRVDSLPAEPLRKPGILEGVAYPFSSGSSQLRNHTGIPCIAGRFLKSWATREAISQKKASTINTSAFVFTLKSQPEPWEAASHFTSGLLLCLHAPWAGPSSLASMPSLHSTPCWCAPRAGTTFCSRSSETSFLTELSPSRPGFNSLLKCNIQGLPSANTLFLHYFQRTRTILL